MSIAGHHDRKSAAVLPPQGLLAIAGMLLALPGCSSNGEFTLHQTLAPQAEVVLHQPFAPPAQQELKLASNWAFEAAADDRRTWLLAFPLPGTPDGPRDFHLYLSTPDGESNFAVDQSNPNAARGFLIQEIGELRGKTIITGGQVQVSKAWFDWRRHALDLNLACADGAVIIGRAIAEPLATEISTFERRYSGDVVALTPQAETRDLAADGASERAKATP